MHIDGRGIRTIKIPDMGLGVKLKDSTHLSASLVPFNKVPNPLSKELHPDLDEDEGSGWKVLKTKGRRDQRWPKEVVIVPKLPRIPQPTREREWQKRMGRNIVVPEDGLQFAKELAELPFKPLMWK